MQKYSVLMSVYAKETAENLRESIDSMLNQTVPPNDFVLVCDGPLTPSLYKVIDFYLKCFPQIFQVYKLPRSMGLGDALNYGLKKCKNEIIARMDSDDIAVQNRCEKQLSVLQALDVDIVSGTVQEFDIESKLILGKRYVPEKFCQIMEFAKIRNPFNHPCVMFNKQAVIKAGGYKFFPFYEDYYLWIRMLINGSKGYNIQECILYMRSGKNFYSRRSGFRYLLWGMRFEKYLLAIKFIDKKLYAANIAIRVMVNLSPNCLRQTVYRYFLRK